MERRWTPPYYSRFPEKCNEGTPTNKWVIGWSGNCIFTETAIIQRWAKIDEEREGVVIKGILKIGKCPSWKLTLHFRHSIEWNRLQMLITRFNRQMFSVDGNNFLPFFRLFLATVFDLKKKTTKHDKTKDEEKQPTFNLSDNCFQFSSIQTYNRVIWRIYRCSSSMETNSEIESHVIS